MWAIEHNGETKTFSSLPKSWGLSDNINETAAVELGFKRVVTPIFNPNVEELANFHLSGDVYTYDVVDKTFPETLAELKAQKIVNLKAIFRTKLESIQWWWNRADRTKGNKPVPQEIQDQDTALRTQCDDIEAQINALTTKKAVVGFVLPNFM